MNLASGRFTQQDSFAGFENHPISLHKYAYANSSPSMLTDPSGNFSLVEASAVNNIVGHLSEFNVSSGFDLGNKLANPESDAPSFEGWSIVFSMIPGAVRVGAGLTQKLKFVANAKAGRGWVKALKGTEPKEIRASEFLADHFGATVIARGQAAGADLYIAGKRWELKSAYDGKPVERCGKDHRCRQASRRYASGRRCPRFFTRSSRCRSCLLRSSAKISKRWIQSAAVGVFSHSAGWHGLYEALNDDRRST